MITNDVTMSILYTILGTNVHTLLHNSEVDLLAYKMYVLLILKENIKLFSKVFIPICTLTMSR